MATLRATYQGADATDKALAIVDKAAEESRKGLATNIYGQDALYIQKALDAERYQLNGAISPLIEADMEAYGVDAQTAASNILAARDSITNAITKVEKIRLRAKNDIRTNVGNVFDIAKQAKKDIENV